MHNILISADSSGPFVALNLKDSDILFAVATANKDHHVIIYDDESFNIGIVDFYEIARMGTIVHAGIQFIREDNFFELTKPIVTNWHFLTPDKNKQNSSWKSTSQFIFIQKGVVESLGGLDNKFSNIDVSLAELTYRCMVCGGRVVCLPIKSVSPSRVNSFSTMEDEFRFIRRHLGRNSLPLLLIYFILSIQLSAFIRLMKWRWVERVNCKPFERRNVFGYTNYHIDSKANNRSYSAIIPTIDRYSYLGKAIISLLNNVCPPQEIIVVDQTPKDRRQTDFYRQYDSNVRVFFLNEPGQCTSRNLAINEAQYEWLLLFEDDAEAWHDMIVEHFNLLESCNADVSTGMSLAPWKDKSYIPERIAFYHNADVLATGNCMVKKEALLSVKGLHPAYNRGSGADDDLGRRLYLNGREMVFNPFAIMTHHKAPSGGMRVHGAWWRNKTRLMQAFPAATEMFTIKEYYHRKYLLIKVVASYLNLINRHTLIQFLAWLIFSPIKYAKANSEYKKIKMTKND